MAAVQQDDLGRGFNLPEPAIEVVVLDVRHVEDGGTIPRAEQFVAAVALVVAIVDGVRAVAAEVEEDDVVGRGGALGEPTLDREGDVAARGFPAKEYLGVLLLDAHVADEGVAHALRVAFREAQVAERHRTVVVDADKEGVALGGCRRS